MNASPAPIDEDHTHATVLDDVRIRQVRPLLSPALLQDEMPADATVQRFVQAQRAQAADIVHGRDARLLVVVGPCSIHDHGQIGRAHV